MGAEQRDKCAQSGSRKLFLQDESQRKQTERCFSFKMNRKTFHKLVRDIMEEKNEERDLKDEVSEKPIKFQTAQDSSFEMEMTWFNRINW